MIDGKFFIMMFSQNCECIMPIVGENELPALFDSMDDAVNAAESHAYASAFGYEIHMVGGDCS